MASMQTHEYEDWRSHLARLREVSPSVALKLIGQVCEGLRQAHSRGVAREYIAPEHLLLEIEVSQSADAEDTVRVRLRPPDATIALDSDDREAERSNYMSPERAQGLKRVDQRSDIWSLGVILFEALTGRTPWGREANASDIIVTMCTRPAPLVQDWAPWVEPEVADIVHTCLQREPVARFESAAELLAAIRAVSGSPTIHTSELVPLPDSERERLADRNEVPPSRAPVDLYEEGRLSLPKDPTVPVIARPRRSSKTVVLIFIVVALSVAALLTWQTIELIGGHP